MNRETAFKLAGELADQGVDCSLSIATSPPGPHAGSRLSESCAVIVSRAMFSEQELIVFLKLANRHDARVRVAHGDVQFIGKARSNG